MKVVVKLCRIIVLYKMKMMSFMLAVHLNDGGTVHVNLVYHWTYANFSSKVS